MFNVFQDLVFQTSDMKQDSLGSNGSPQSVDGMLGSSSIEESTTTSMYQDCNFDVDETKSNGGEAPSSESPWYHLRKEATTFVSQTLQRGRKNLWQLTTSRVSVLLSSAVFSSMSVHQFLKNYDDLNVFILAGEAFCGVEAIEFRQKLKAVCENYLLAFHRQNIHVSCLPGLVCHTILVFFACTPHLFVAWYFHVSQREVFCQ